jgi:hypothetical protein
MCGKDSKHATVDYLQHVAGRGNGIVDTNIIAPESWGSYTPDRHPRYGVEEGSRDWRS